MEYLIHLATLFAIYAILGVSLNLVVGYTGLLATTQAALYGVGAYTTALVLTNSNVGFLSSVLLGILIAMTLSLLIGIVLSKFDTDYYALGSLGFGVIIFSIMLSWDGVTRGPLGIAGIDKPEIFGLDFSSSPAFLILAALCLALIYLIARAIVGSSFGRVLKAIREDEKAAQVFGYNTQHFKLVIFIISGGMAALAGSLFASYATYIDPSTFTIIESIFILAIVILGGLANMKGPLLGALILILLPELLRFVGFPGEIAGQMRELIYGCMLVLLMLYRPRGLLGEYKL